MAPGFSVLAASNATTNNAAKFEDLPLEILIPIAEYLLAAYQETRPKHKTGRQYDFNGLDPDTSFFEFRKASQTTGSATRMAFFQSAGEYWATQEIDTQEKRIDTEENLARSVQQLQSLRNAPCRVCDIKNCMAKHSGRVTGRDVRDKTRTKIAELYHEYLLQTSTEPEMLFHPGHRARIVARPHYFRALKPVVTVEPIGGRGWAGWSQFAAQEGI